VLGALPGTRAWLRDALALLCAQGKARLLAARQLHAQLSRLLVLVMAQEERLDSRPTAAPREPIAPGGPQEDGEPATAAGGGTHRRHPQREGPTEDGPPPPGTAWSEASGERAAARPDPPTFPGPSVSICRAGRCLRLSNLPPEVSEAALVAEVSRSAAVESVLMGGAAAGAGLAAGEACVVFRSTIP
jgi:hypothetical protein